MSKQTEKQKKALAESQAIMKLTPKYRAEGMSLKEAWKAAKKEYFKGKDSGQAGMTNKKNPLAKTVCYKRGVNPKSRKTVNGYAVKSSRVFKQGDYYRWRVVDVNGRVYTDGGNYTSRREAMSGLRKGLDKHNPSIPKKELEFREGKRRGSIMKPGTFKKIEKKAKKAGYKDPKAVARRKNPPDNIPSMVEIYGQALETHARKGNSSLFAGQEFVHDWEKAGTKIFGLPAGTIISLPDGDSVTLDQRTVIMINKKEDLWDLFKQ